MPLGFAKSTFTHKAAASGSSSYGAYRQTNALSTGNLAGWSAENLNFNADNDISVVFWFRANGADNDGDSDDWIDGASGSGSGSEFFQVPHSSGIASGNLRFQYTNQDFGWNLQVRQDRNAVIDGRGLGNTATQAADSFDGSWKCCMIGFKADFDFVGDQSNNNTTGNASERNFQAVYVNDTDYTNMPNGHTRGVWNGSNYTNGHLGYDSGSFTTTMTLTQNIGPGFHIGPLWVYNSFINFNTQSERRKYYDPANTDGFITPTDTGTTTAGATQPNLYFYWDGSTLNNGGSDSITLTKRTVGTGGDFTDITDGPGSGGTI
jgi:hypothetical protein